MPIIENNPAVANASGKLGNILVYRRSKHGLVLANKPKKATSVDPVQIAFRQRFADAVYYAKRQLTKDEVKALYQTGVTRKKGSAFVVAVSDYLSSPKIKQIDAESYRGLVGQPIHIHAADDFRVMSVSVVIRSAAGQEIERGEAALTLDLREAWAYTATVENPLLEGTSITVTVKDLAGNATSETLTL